MKQRKMYKKLLHLNENRVITAVQCTCVAEALGRCKHIYAVIHYINNDRGLSKTSIEQEWGRPSVKQMGKEKYSGGKLISELKVL